MSIISSNHIGIKSMSLQGLYELSCHVKTLLPLATEVVSQWLTLKNGSQRPDLTEKMNELLLDISIYNATEPNFLASRYLHVDNLVGLGLLNTGSDIEEIKKVLFNFCCCGEWAICPLKSIEDLCGMCIKGYNYNPSDYIKIES